MKNKGILISSIILITVGLLGIMSLSIFSGFFTQRSLYRLDISMMDNLDRRFIEEMIPHHEDAVLMAELALKKSDNEKILSNWRSLTCPKKKDLEQVISITSNRWEMRL